MTSQKTDIVESGTTVTAACLGGDCGSCPGRSNTAKTCSCSCHGTAATETTAPATAKRPSWVPKGGVCSEHGPYEIGPDCSKCIQEVLAWTS